MNTTTHRQDSDQSTALAENLSRRAALGRLGGTALAVTILATTRRDRILAQSTPEPEGTGMPPNGFTLDGDETHINYGTTSIDGRPILSYRGPYGEHSFHGDEIQTEESPALGGLVSVLLHAEPDNRVVFLTLLLPSFNPVHLGDPPIPFSTAAVLTTHPTTIAGPGLVKGPLQTYELVALTGTALFAMS